MPECLFSWYSHNGQLRPASDFRDDFLQRPHYIYEVFRVTDGVALFLEDHLERLQQTCALSEHCPGFSSGDVSKHVYEVIHANALQTGNLKMVLYPDPVSGSHFLIYITPHEYPDAQQIAQGVPVALFKGIRHNPNAKIMDVRLRNATNLMKEQMEVYETLLVDQQGCITEGSRSNVFFIRNNKVITPPVEDVLPGITRKHVMEVCKELGIEVNEEKVLARSVVVMEAAFLSGTSRKVLPIRSIDELEFAPKHPLVLKIAEGFNNRAENYVNNYLSSH